MSHGPTPPHPAPPHPDPLSRGWIRVGLAAGVLAMADYMLLVLLPGPDRLLLALALGLAPLLAAGAVGVYRVAALHRPSVALQLGCGTAAAAGFAFTLMAAVQLSVHASLGAIRAAGAPQIGTLQRGLDGVRLGLDLVWDWGFGLGAVLVAWALLRHPRFGPLFTVPGLLLGAAVPGLAFYAFPADTAAADLIDLGPLLALWWLAVTARALLSQAWVEERLGAPPAAAPAAEPG